MLSLSGVPGHSPSSDFWPFSFSLAWLVSVHVCLSYGHSMLCVGALVASLCMVWAFNRILSHHVHGFPLCSLHVVLLHHKCTFESIACRYWQWPWGLLLQALAMAIAPTSPLCTWLIAAYMSSGVSGLADDVTVSAGPSGRPSGRRLRRRNASSKRLAGASWSPKTSGQLGSLSGESIAAFCGSGISGLGLCFAFEGCPEYANLKHEPLFGDVSFFGDGLGGLRPKPLRAARRQLKAAAGKGFSLAFTALTPSF